MSSSASSRRTAAPRPTRCSQGLEIIPRSASSYAGKHARGDGPRRRSRPAAGARARRRARPHQCARAAAIRSAISTSRSCCAAGIDVYTTLNIQHVESLNDVVAQITRIRVRETVPDSILDRADDIEVIDLSPDDLIQRLHEGKVYVPAQAERALDHYFSPGNLTALRELALRRTAERVDEQLRTHMQAHAIAGPWPAGERLLVCVSEDPHSAGLIRYAKRTADRLHAPWTALYIETRTQPALLRQTSATASRRPCRLAEQLGGEAIDACRAAARIADDVLATPAPTTSRRSSSANRAARAGSRCCMARSCTISCVVPARSACMSLPASRSAPNQHAVTRRP